MEKKLIFHGKIVAMKNILQIKQLLWKRNISIEDIRYIKTILKDTSDIINSTMNHNKG